MVPQAPSPQLEIAAPAWNQTPHLLTAKHVLLEVRHVDLWRAYRGQRLRIHKLQVRATGVEYCPLT